jgi:hypothetical protein
LDCSTALLHTHWSRHNFFQTKVPYILKNRDFRWWFYFKFWQ